MYKKVSISDKAVVTICYLKIVYKSMQYQVIKSTITIFQTERYPPPPPPPHPTPHTPTPTPTPVLYLIGEYMLENGLQDFPGQRGPGDVTQGYFMFEAMTYL